MKKIYSGRSMVEMLGVLAIMGMLAIGGLSGIRFLLDKKMASEIMDEALTQASEIKARRRKYVRDGQIRYGGASQSRYITSRTYSEDGDYLILKTNNDISKNVCEMLFSDVPVMIFETITTENGSCEDTNTLIFSTDTELLLPEQMNCCGHGKYENGACTCDEGWTGNNCCKPDCPDPTYIQTCARKANEYDKRGCLIKDYYTMPCGGVGEYCKDDECHSCPEGSVVNSAGDDCDVCDAEKGMRANADQTKCICNPGKIYMEADEQCHDFSCDENGLLCYIDGKLCGYQCNPDGSNCDLGVCLDEECEEYNGPLSLIEFDAQYRYGCKVNHPSSDGIICYGGILDDYYRCYSKINGKSCMQTYKDLTPYDGSCDSSLCDALKEKSPQVEWALFGSDANSYRGACQINDNLICVPRFDAKNWRCYYDGVECNAFCSDPLNCDNCLQNLCLNDYVYNETTGYCEKDEHFCTIEENKTYQSCYESEEDKTNNRTCMLVSSKNFMPAFGSCSDPGCNTDVGMNFDYVLAKTVTSYKGCVKDIDSKTKLECFYNSAYKPAECYYGGALCGRACDYDGTNCSTVYLPQCAREGSCPQTGYEMSDGCTCEGSITTFDNKRYCCTAGHRYINEKCTLTTCPDGKYVTFDGFCVDECPDGQNPNEDNICT